MSKPFEFTIFLNTMKMGSMVLKAPGQYYKINGLLQAVPLAAEVEQFTRSVVAGGATPKLGRNLDDLRNRAYGFELRFNELVCLDLLLKTADGGKAMVFEWAGKFGDFRDGFKVF